MSKETSNTDIQVNQFEAGIQLVTTQTEVTRRVYNSLDEAITDREDEFFSSRLTGVAIGAMGMTVAVGGLLLLDDSKEVEQTFAALGTVSAGIMAAGIGIVVYKSGDIAKSQWKKLTELKDRLQRNRTQES